MEDEMYDIYFIMKMQMTMLKIAWWWEYRTQNAWRRMRDQQVVVSFPSTTKKVFVSLTELVGRGGNRSVRPSGAYGSAY